MAPTEKMTRVKKKTQKVRPFMLGGWSNRNLMEETKIGYITCQQLQMEFLKNSSQDALDDKLAGMSLTPSQSPQNGILALGDNKPYKKGSSTITSQHALNDKFARISLTPSQTSERGILAPAANKTYKTGSPKISVSACDRPSAEVLVA